MFRLFLFNLQMQRIFTKKWIYIISKPDSAEHVGKVLLPHEDGAQVLVVHYVENLGVGELANVNVLLPQLQYALLCTKFNKTVALDTCCTQLHLQSMLTTDADLDRWIIDRRLHSKDPGVSSV